MSSTSGPNKRRRVEEAEEDGEKDEDGSEAFDFPGEDEDEDGEKEEDDVEEVEEDAG